MTQSVSLAAMIPVMLPEDLKDNFFFSSTQMLQIFFLQLRHMDIIMSGDNLYPTLCYHSVTLDLDFNLETNISGFDWYILIIRDFFLFHVFYFILLFFFFASEVTMAAVFYEGHQILYAGLPVQLL